MKNIAQSGNTMRSQKRHATRYTLKTESRYYEALGQLGQDELASG